MPNVLDANGLQVATFIEIQTNLVTGYQAIYGAGINVNSNSPDGQVINILTQNISDTLQLLNQIYNSFNPDSAFGVVLDARVAMSGIQRQQGTFTAVWVQVTVSTALSLTGQDALISNPAATVFTVADGANNQYELVTTYAFGAAGTATLVFTSSVIGQVQVLANTVSNIVTTQAGVTSVNNPLFSLTTTGTVSASSPVVTGIPNTAGTTAGMLFTGANVPNGTFILSVDSSSQVTLTAPATGPATGELIVIATPATVEGLPEETDPQLKIRRANSYYLQSVSPADAIRAALLNVADISDAYVVDNTTGSTVSSVPAHSIWVIVTGGLPSEIANVIYAKKAPGCGVFGAVTYNVVRPQGNIFTAKWDASLTQPLYIQSTLVPRIPGLTFNVTSDGIALADALAYKLGQSPNVGDIVIAMQAIEPNAILTNTQVSIDGITWEDIVSPTTSQFYFITNSANISLVNS